MRRQLGLPTLAAISTLLVATHATPAAARPQGLPSLYADIGTVVVLGGTTGGVADPFTAKRIVVRDATGLPAANVTVALDFTACTGADVRLCSSQPDPGIMLTCGTHRVIALTDVNGLAVFHITGHALNPGGGVFNAPAPGYGAAGATVYADGQTMGTLVVAALDQDGQGGLNVVDVALFLNDRFSFNPGNPAATLRGRSDVDGNQSINPTDLALLLQARGAGGSLTSCGSTCP
jgi:hypothetical protein